MNNKTRDDLDPYKSKICLEKKLRMKLKKICSKILNMNIVEKVKQITEKLSIKEPPVSLDKVAELFSLKIIYYPKFPENISGTIINDNNQTYIGVNSNHHTNRQRFTIAHEIGHYIMGHESSEIIDDRFDKPVDQEKEANDFASELLIPKNILIKDIENNSYDIPMLAKRYEVSEQVMAIRLLHSGLIKKIKIKK